MEKMNFRIPVFLAVFVALVTVLAACAPAITPGVAPREISAPFVSALDEEIAQGAASTEGLSGESAVVTDDATLEDVLSRLDNITVPNIDEDLFGGFAAPVEGQIEEHMVTQFTTGIASLEDEFLSAFGLALVEGQLEENLTEASPAIISVGEEFLDIEAAPVEGQIEEHMVTQFTTGTVSSLDDELAGIEAAPVERQIEEHMVTQFNTGTVSLDDELLSVLGLSPWEGQVEEDVTPYVAPMEYQITPGVTWDTMMDDYY